MSTTSELLLVGAVGSEGPAGALRTLLTHRYERVVAVVPAAALALCHDVLSDVLRGARCSRWSDASAPVLELSLRAE